MIEFEESVPESVDLLRLTLPQLTKHRLPPNPLHYTLWYSYVGQHAPGLNTALDDIITRHGAYTTAQAKQLLQDHVLKLPALEAPKMAARIQQLAQTLREQLQKTAHSSDGIDRDLQNTLQEMQHARDSADLDHMMSVLMGALQAFGDSNRKFREHVNETEARATSLQEELEQVQRLADLDTLTGLYNRNMFERELREQIQRPNDLPLSLIMCDIDHFKQFNDKFGHLLGDRVLRMVGQLLRNSIRSPGFAARYGGEEFTVIAPDATLEQAMNIAERLRASVERLRVTVRNSERVLDNISASFGVALYQPGDTVEELFERADQALYRAKHDGRNCVRSQVDLKHQEKHA